MSSFWRGSGRRAAVRKWQGRETGELADGVRGLYPIIAGSGIFFLLAKLLIFEEELQVTVSNIYLETHILVKAWSKLAKRRCVLFA